LIDEQVIVVGAIRSRKFAIGNGELASGTADDVEGLE